MIYINEQVPLGGLISLVVDSVETVDVIMLGRGILESMSLLMYTDRPCVPRVIFSMVLSLPMTEHRVSLHIFSVAIHDNWRSH